MSLPLDCPRRFIHSIPRRRGTIGICVALLTLCSISSPRGAQPSATTLAAIVNESGVLAPIVRFDGSAWRHSWPEPGTVVAADVAAGTTAPLAWTGGVRPPATWYALRRDAPLDAQAHAIRVGALVRVESHCTPAFGLQSDLRDVPPSAGGPPPTPERTFPKRAIALAVSNPEIHIQPLETVDEEAPIMREPLRAAEAAFLAAAAKMATRDGWTLPARGPRVRWTKHKMWSYTLSADAKPTHAMAALKAADVDRVYLLEGRAPIDPSAPEGPSLLGFVWLRMRHHSVIEREATVMPWDADGKFDRTHVPMGVIAIGERRFWLSLVHGYEHEEQEIIELTKPGFPVASSAARGGC